MPTIKTLSPTMRETIPPDEKAKTWFFVLLCYVAVTLAISVFCFGFLFLPFFLGAALFGGYHTSLFVQDILGLRYRFQRVFYPYREVIDLKIYFLPCLVGYTLFHALLSYLPILLVGVVISLGSIIGRFVEKFSSFNLSELSQAQSTGAVTALVLYVFLYKHLEWLAAWVLTNKRMVHMVKHPNEYTAQLSEMKIEKQKKKLKDRKARELESETVVISDEQAPFDPLDPKNLF